MKLFKVFLFTLFLFTPCIPLLSWGMEDFDELEGFDWDEKLFIKIREKDIAGVIEALDNDASVNKEVYCIDDRDRSVSFATKPIHEAVKRGLYDLSVLLLRIGAGIDDPDGRGNAPLHWAAENGSIDVLLLLLNEGAGMVMKSGEGPLSYGPVSVFANGDLPLHRAVKHKKYAAVVLLYDESLLEVKNANGKTPRDFAAKFDTTINKMVEQGLKEFWGWYSTQNELFYSPPEHVRKMLIQKGYLPSFQQIQNRIVTGKPFHAKL